MALLRNPPTTRRVVSKAGIAALCLALVPACGSPAGDDDGSGETGGSESASAGETSAETSAETSSSEESGETTAGDECVVVESAGTSFDIDVSNWPVAFESGQAQLLACTTTQAEVQGLGLVMNFDCTDETDATGSVQITVAGLGVIDPPMSVGSEVELRMGGEFIGGDAVQPERELGFTTEWFSIRDGQGLLVGAVGSDTPEPLWAPMAMGTVNPCEPPDTTETFQGRLSVAHASGMGDAEIFAPGEIANWAGEDGLSYRIDVGRVDVYGCCHNPFWVEFVVSRESENP